MYDLDEPRQQPEARVERNACNRGEPLMVKVVHRADGPVLRVNARPGKAYAAIEVYTDFGRTPAARFQELLGLLVAQAFHDGMVGISLGADPDAQSVWLRYYGPREAPCPRWWEMMPPPAEAYAALVKAIVGLATFAPGLHPSGVIRAEINGEPVEVRVEVRSWYDISLCWGEVAGGSS